MTEQEALWQGNWGNQYLDRNDSLLLVASHPIFPVGDGGWVLVEKRR